MVDWGKKIQKHSESQLYPGEQVEAGTFVQPGGSVTRQVGLGVGGVVGAVAANKLSKNNATGSSDAGVGAEFPQTRAVLGLSSQRLMVFAHGSMSGKPKEMLTSVPLADVAAMSAEKNKVTYTLSIAFADGSATSYEAVKLAKPEEFVETFKRLHG